MAKFNAQTLSDKNVCDIAQIKGNNMDSFKINSEQLPSRCEICHQSDCFDSITNSCSRCSNVEQNATKFNNLQIKEKKVTIKLNEPLIEKLRKFNYQKGMGIYVIINISAFFLLNILKFKALLGLLILSMFIVVPLIFIFIAVVNMVVSYYENYKTNRVVVFIHDIIIHTGIIT